MALVFSFKTSRMSFSSGRQYIVWVYDALHSFGGKVQVPGSLQATMAHQFFYGMQVNSIVYKVRCKAVANGMYGIVFICKAGIQ